MTNPEMEQHEHLVKPEELPPGIELRPHVYDGIQEYDQRLPNWWLWTLYIFIIGYGVFWLAYYQFGLFKDDEARLAGQMNVIAAKQTAELEALLADLDPGDLWEMSRDSQFVSAGKTIYTEKCVACHAADLSSKMGGVQLPGVPLNSKEWLYCMLEGTTVADAFTTDAMRVFELIQHGSPDPTKGMQAWGPELGPKRVAEVAAYVLSYHEAPPMETQPDTP